MREIDFHKLPQLVNEDDFREKLRRGDFFLYGRKMISQVESKQPGDQICYYQVIKIDGKNVEYMTKFDILEKNNFEKEDK